MRSIICLLLITACVGFGGVAFGINPIGIIPECYIGYQVGPAIPYFSINYAGFSGSFEYRYNGSVDTYEASASVLMPTLGAKLIFGSSDFKPFINFSTGKPFFAVDVEVDDPYFEDDLDDFIDGLRSTFVFTGGAGVEYFFAEQFSVGGEFRYRLLTFGGEWEFYDDEFTDVRGLIGATSTGMWLNYYF